MKKLFFYALIMAMTVVNVTFTACTSEQEEQILDLFSFQSMLKLNVNTAEITAARALIESTYLPDKSEIGVTLLASDGNSYDGKSYTNIKFTATGTEESQEWTGSSNILLSATAGNVYAYYPYSSSVTDITKIPVETDSQTDYMYATKVSDIYDGEPNANIKMNHALAAIRFALKKGTYTGTGTVTSVSVKSSAVATGASMNSKDGSLNSFTGSDAEISVTKGISLTTSEQNADVIVVPTGTNAALTLKVVIDGKSYSVTTDALSLSKGNIYKYTVTVNSTSLDLSGVTVGDWSYNSSGNPVIDLGYKVTIAGNMSDIALANTVSGSTLTIKAVPFVHGKNVNEITYEGTASVSQSIDGDSGIRTIIVGSLQSNVTVSFAGTSYLLTMNGDQSGMTVSKSIASDGTVTITATPTVEKTLVSEVEGSGDGIMTQTLNGDTGVRTIVVKNQTGPYTITFKGTEEKVDGIKPSEASNGVYAVNASGNLVPVDEADESCVAVALVVNDAPTPQKIMINKGRLRKYPLFYDYDSPIRDKPSFKFIPYNNIDGENINGYLPLSDGTYIFTPKLEDDYTTWTSGALSDFNGKDNTKNIVDAASYIYLDTGDVGMYIKEFNNESIYNLGYNDWYIPACGQLALITLNSHAIDSALEKIDGEILGGYHAWVSSTINENLCSWCIENMRDRRYLGCSHMEDIGSAESSASYKLIRNIE